MSLAGDEVNSNYKEKLESELKLNKALFEKKMEDIKLEKDETKKTYLSEPTIDILFSGISDSGLKLIGIEYKNTYFEVFRQEVLEGIDGTHKKENRTPPKGGRKTKSKKSNRRNTRKHRKSRKSRK